MVSSAKRIVHSNVPVDISDKSFMQIKKSRGPKVDPCGIPHVIFE